jgi:hypothetical protein
VHGRGQTRLRPRQQSRQLQLPKTLSSGWRLGKVRTSIGSAGMWSLLSIQELTRAFFLIGLPETAVVVAVLSVGMGTRVGLVRGT